MRVSKQITHVYPVPNDPDKAEVEIIHLLTGEVEDINEDIGAFKTVVRRHDDGTMNPELEQAPKIGNRRYLLVQKAVKSWINVRDEDGNDIPCTEESKLLVLRSNEVEVDRENGEKEVISFAAWVNECRSDLAKRVRESKVVAEKN